MSFEAARDLEPEYICNQTLLDALELKLGSPIGKFLSNDANQPNPFLLGAILNNTEDTGLKTEFTDYFSHIVLSEIAQRTENRLSKQKFQQLSELLPNVQLPPPLYVAASNMVSFLIAREQTVKFGRGRIVKEDERGLPIMEFDPNFNLVAIYDVAGMERANNVDKNIGDLYVQKSAELLQDALVQLGLAEHYFIARIGGDELIVCSYGPNMPEFDRKLFNDTIYNLQISDAGRFANFPRFSEDLSRIEPSFIELVDQTELSGKEGAGIDAHIEQLMKRAIEFNAITHDKERLTAFIQEDTSGWSLGRMLTVAKGKLVYEYSSELPGLLDELSVRKKWEVKGVLSKLLFTRREAKLAINTRTIRECGPAIDAKPVAVLHRDSIAKRHTFVDQAKDNKELTNVDLRLMSRSQFREEFDLIKENNQEGELRMVIVGIPGLLKTTNDSLNHHKGDLVYDQIIDYLTVAFQKGMLGDIAWGTIINGQFVGLIKKKEGEDTLEDDTMNSKSQYLLFDTEFNLARPNSRISVPKPLMLQVYEQKIIEGVDFRTQINAVMANSDYATGGLLRDLFSADVSTKKWHMVDKSIQIVADWLAIYLGDTYGASGKVINKRKDSRLKRMGFKPEQHAKEALLRRVQSYLTMLQAYGEDWNEKSKSAWARSLLQVSFLCLDDGFQQIAEE